MHGAACLHCRDSEKGFVSVNGDRCWTSKSFQGGDGTHQCGYMTQSYMKDTLVAVKCEAEAVDGKLTVLVDTNMKGSASEESFAIDNVAISPVYAGK